jgi:hypothetical protein
MGPAHVAMNGAVTAAEAAARKRRRERAGDIPKG